MKKLGWQNKGSGIRKKKKDCNKIWTKGRRRTEETKRQNEKQGNKETKDSSSKANQSQP